MSRLFGTIGISFLLGCLSVAFSNEVRTFETSDSPEVSAHSRSGRAIILAVGGGVEYKNGNDWRPLQAGADFYDRLVLRTMTNSYADLWINDNTSMIRVLSESLIEVPHMRLTDSNSATTVYLRGGGVMAVVGSLATDSRYEVATPHGFIEFGHGAGVIEVAVAVNSATNDPRGLSINSLAGTVNVLDMSGANTALKAGEHWDTAQPLTKPLDQPTLNELKPAFAELEKTAGPKFKP